MKSYKIKNRILKLLFDHERNYNRLRRENKEFPGYSHLSSYMIAEKLKLNEEDVEFNIHFLMNNNEVVYEEFEQDYWGYKITSKGKARLANKYTNNEEKDRKLNRTLSYATIFKIVFTVFSLPFVLELAGWILDIDLLRLITMFLDKVR